MRAAYVHTRVLVVDDDKGAADRLALILRACGYDLFVAYNAKDAIAVARTYPPDILIADAIMPRMSGIDLAEWFEEKQPYCEVLLLADDPAGVESALAGRHLSVLAKPVSPRQVVEFIAANGPAAKVSGPG
jgi:DNA-binding response OmpR family regulator